MLDSPFPPFVLPPAGDARCPGCAAALASDQRYCLSCGEPVHPLGDWAGEFNDVQPVATAEPGAASASRLPAPRSTALMTLLVLALGVFIGGAFGPQSTDTLADNSDQSVVVVAGSPAAPALRPASPAAADTTSSLADIAAGGGGAGAAAGSANAVTTLGGIASGPGVSDSGLPVSDSTAATPTGGGSGGGSGTTGGSGQTPTLPPIKHVFTVAMSTPDEAHLLGPGGPAYLRSELVARGARLAGFRAVAGGDLAARIALVSGQAPSAEIRTGCPTYMDLLPGRVDAHGLATGTGCVFPRPVKTVAAQLGVQGLAWRAYAQGLVTPCRHPVPGAPDDTALDRPTDHFGVAATPFLYFHSIIDTGDCNAGVVPVERLKDDLASVQTTPNYAFIAPDRCHDGREGACADGQPAGAAGADAFLRQWIPAILASPAYRQDGLLIVAGGRGDHAGALLVSRYVSAGHAVRARYDEYSLLRTVEDLFGLGHLGRAADQGTKALGSDVFATTG
jgi:phosphatidylinositol-3-phosphatase